MIKYIVPAFSIDDLMQIDGYPAEEWFLVSKDRTNILARMEFGSFQTIKPLPIGNEDETVIMKEVA
jgi:hypothetical protein